MAGTRISAHYPPHIDVTRTPIAYGDRALPRLNCELKATQLITRQRALMSLCDYLKDPEHIATAIQQGTVSLLTALLFDPDTIVRQKSAECLNSFASHAVGRDAFITHHVIAPLSTLFHDPSDIVRLNAHTTMSRAAMTPIGAMEVVDQQIIPLLVNKLRSEGVEILELILDMLRCDWLMQELILETLHHCFKVDVQSALNNNCMLVLTELLQHSHYVIRARAARGIMGLTSTLPGKEQAIEDRCVPELVTLLEDDEASVKANAAGALMRIVITTRGKYTALEAGALPRLVEIVQNENSEVRLNTLKAITSLSEAPEGRAYLLEHKQLFQDTCADPVAAVAAAAEKALAVILWVP